MTRHLCLVDPAIVDWVGHYAEYARSIAAQARRLSIGFSVLARRTVAPELAKELDATPAFRYDFWHRVTRRRWPGFFINPVLSNWAFYGDLRRALAGRATADWVLFMPTVDHHQMLAWAWWLAGIPPARRPSVVLLFRYTYFWGDATRPWRESLWLRPAFRLLAPFGRTGHVRFVTDSARLARQYARFTSYPMEVVPIPHTGDLHGDNASDPAEARPITFVSLGDARAEKGFAIIAQAIQRLHLYAPHQLEGVEFTIQCPITHSSHAAMIEPRRALANLRLPNVRLVDAVLSRPDYSRLLEQASVVLLPYSRGIYYARTSGPFTEALAAGKPVIATEDTWMSDQLAQHGAGVTVCDNDADDLARAIVEARDRFPALARQARERRAAWVAFHDPGNLVGTLLEGPSFRHSGRFAHEWSGQSGKS